MAQVLPPTLVLAFNRPELTRRLVDLLLHAGTGILYAHVDGPRAGVASDAGAVESVIAQLARLRSDFDLHLRLSSENLGCAWGPVEGISWFFEAEDSGVILEDDILPSAHFFKVMRGGLSAYEETKNVYSLQGYSHLPWRNSSRFRMSRFSGSWGWASWASRWKRLKVSPTYWAQNFPLSYSLRHFGAATTLFWIRRLMLLVKSEREGNLSVWDYQWLWTHWRDHALAAVAPVNLVENLALEQGATHKTPHFGRAVSGYLDLDEWIHSEFPRQVDKAADRWQIDHVYRSSLRGVSTRLKSW